MGREDPLEEEIAAHSSILAWRIPWTKELCGLQSTGSRRVCHHWSKLAHTPLFSYPPEWSKEGTYQDDPRGNTSFLILSTCRNMWQAELGSWASCDPDWGGRWSPHLPGPKPSDTLCLSITSFQLFFLSIDWFIWPCWILVVAHGIFDLCCRIFSCGMWSLCCSMWDLIPWPRIEPRLDKTCTGSLES